MGHGGKPWVSDFNDPNYVAGRNAVKTGIFSLLLPPRLFLLYIGAGV